MSKIILDLCGGTGAWSKPYKDTAYDVRLITLPDYDLSKEQTVQYCIDLKPYGILCATPCDMWSLMGNCRWKERTAQNILDHSILLVHNLRVIHESNPNFWCI